MEQLWRNIERAQQEAEDLDVAEQRDQEENILFEGFLSGRLTLKEYHDQDPRGDTLYPGEVEIPTMEMLYESLLRCVRRQIAEELVDHEQDHYDEAISAGFDQTKILIRFFQENGSISLRPAIMIVLPKAGDETEIRRSLRAIIEAPEELSDTDQAQLGRESN